MMSSAQGGISPSAGNFGTGLKSDPAGPKGPPKSLLLVLPDDEDYHRMHPIAGRSSWTIHRSHTCREAVAFLSEHPVSVVITDREPSRDDWKKLLGAARHMPFAPKPKLIIAYRFAESHAAAQLLRRGAYQILAKPFHEGEVARALGFAWAQCKRDWELGQRTSSLTKATAAGS